MTNSEGLSIHWLKVPVGSLRGLNPIEQCECLCRAGKSRAIELSSRSFSADDQSCLLSYIETMAIQLLDKPLRAGFRDTTRAAKHRQELDSRLVSLVLANKGQLPLDITGFRSNLTAPTTLARELVDVVTTWSTATSLLYGAKLLARLGKLPSALEVTGEEIAERIDFSPIGDPLIQPRDGRPDLQPRAETWEQNWDREGLLQSVHDALGAENQVSLVGLLASTRAFRELVNAGRHSLTLLIDTIRSHKQALVQDLRTPNVRMTFKQVQQFLDETFEEWTTEFRRIWNVAQADWRCPVCEPIAPYLPVVENGERKCLRMLAASEELVQQVYFRQVRRGDGVQSSAAKSAIGKALRTASRELARFQVRLIWPEFPLTGNMMQSDDYCVGIEEKKSILGIMPASEIDLWVADRVRKRIVVGEVKVGNMAVGIKGLSREYENFGRGGDFRAQLATKLIWAGRNRHEFLLPWGGTSEGWKVSGAVFTNVFPEVVWALHHDLPGIAPIGSDKAAKILRGE